MKLLSPRPTAVRNRRLPTSLEFSTEEINHPEDREDDNKDFLTSHFGNPEKDENYGVGNDYETEVNQIRDEKASASQAIWYLGAFVMIMVIGVLLFGYR
ncbi:MAG: hypothetical protein KAY82_01355 [Hylemonella sp.]|nr:hypothetical protein [Hylemonella sp.]